MLPEIKTQTNNEKSEQITQEFEPVQIHQLSIEQKIALINAISAGNGPED